MAEQIEIRVGDVWRNNVDQEEFQIQDIRQGFIKINDRWWKDFLLSWTFVSRAPAAEKWPEQPDRVEVGQRYAHPASAFTVGKLMLEIGGATKHFSVKFDDGDVFTWPEPAILCCTFLGYAKTEGECGCTNAPSKVTVTFGPPATTPDDRTLPTQPTERRAIDGLGVKLPDEPLDFRKGLVDVVRINEIEGVSRQLKGAMK